MTKILLACAALVLLSGAPTDAADVTYVSAAGVHFIPGATDLPVTLVVGHGHSLGFVNVDPLGWHWIASTAVDEQGEPIFSSDFIGLGMTSPVRGVELLAPGSYSFVCPVHVDQNMRGLLTVT